MNIKILLRNLKYHNTLKHVFARFTLENTYFFAIENIIGHMIFRSRIIEKSIECEDVKDFFETLHYYRKELMDMRKKIITDRDIPIKSENSLLEIYLDYRTLLRQLEIQVNKDAKLNIMNILKINAIHEKEDKSKELKQLTHKKQRLEKMKKTLTKEMEFLDKKSKLPRSWERRRLDAQSDLKRWERLKKNVIANESIFTCKRWSVDESKMFHDMFKKTCEENTTINLKYENLNKEYKTLHDLHKQSVSMKLFFNLIEFDLQRSDLRYMRHEKRVFISYYLYDEYFSLYRKMKCLH